MKGMFSFVDAVAVHAPTFIIIRVVVIVVQCVVVCDGGAVQRRRCVQWVNSSCPFDAFHIHIHGLLPTVMVWHGHGCTHSRSMFFRFRNICKTQWNATEQYIKVTMNVWSWGYGIQTQWNQSWNVCNFMT